MRVVLILSTLSFAGAAQAAPFTCPAQAGRALEHVTLFDGPPREMASMRPEDGREVGGRLRQSWRIAEIDKLGRRVHVECVYEGGSTQVVQAPRRARTCVQDLRRLDKKGRYKLLSFSCR